MKRTIAMISTGMAIGFALALAHANDTTQQDEQAGTAPTYPTYPNRMTPGTEATPSILQTPSSMDMGQDTTSDTDRDMGGQVPSDVTASRTCVDEAGIIHRSGTEGFKACQQAKDKNGQKDETGN